MSQTRKNIFLLVSLFYTLYIMFPIFADLVRIPVWLPSLVSSVIMVCLFPKAFKNRIVIWFLLYASILALFVIVGKELTIGIGTVEDSKKMFIEYAFILPTLCIFSILYYLQDFHLTKKYVIWSVVILYASFFVALPLMNQYNSWREALSEQDDHLSIPGLPSYSLMHAYTLFLPAVCYAQKYAKGTLKIISLFALLLLCYVIYGTFVTTSLIVMLGIIVFAYTYDDRRTSVYWLTVIVLVLIFYLCYVFGLFFDFIDWIRPFFANTAVDPKLDDLQNSMMAGHLQGNSITVRLTLHSTSWDSFFENPLWGTSIVGGHSSLLDRLGGMGIMGGIPFLMIIISFLKYSLAMLVSKRARVFLVSGFVAGFIYLYEKSIWGQESWLMLMVMMPMTLWVLDNSIFKLKK